MSGEMKDESLLLTGWCARLEKELLSCGLNSLFTKFWGEKRILTLKSLN